MVAAVAIGYGSASVSRQQILAQSITLINLPVSYSTTSIMHSVSYP